MLKTINWKIFGVLLAAGLAGVLAVLPLAMEIVGVLPMTREADPGIPMPLVFLLALLQNGILLSILIVIGMNISDRIGLQMPLVSSFVLKEPGPRARSVLLPGILLGTATGIIMVLIETVFFVQNLPETMLSLFDIPLWKRLLAGVLYGGITEELFMRLFLLSLVVWLLGKIWKTADGKPTIGAFWTAIVLVALIFGLGHLPITAALTPLTQAIVVRALLLNGLAGVTFGYLYWRNGLEAAVAAHMSVHVILQIPGVMLIKSLLL